MRIISKFKDYYDGVGAFYKDKTPIYLRNEKEIKWDKDINRIGGEVIIDKKTYDFSTNFIGFCGKLYIYTKIEEKYNYYCNTEVKYFYDPAEIDKYLAEAEFQRSRGRHTWSWKTKRVNFVDTYEKMKQDHKDLLTIFTDQQCPAFTVTNYSGRSGKKGYHIVLNPCLKDCQFFKVFDSHRTYQEIDMYFGGCLTSVEDPDMPVGGDVVVAESKGFDKFSFRAEKGGKKRKRNKK